MVNTASKKAITLAHGSGGRATRQLLDQTVLRHFGSPDEQGLQDLAFLKVAASASVAFTTDSYVVNPLFFPGGDIGKLAVNGTVNDLAVGGAKPLLLSCSLIMEEGLEIEVLDRVMASMAQAAETAGVRIVTGDTKVVEHGAADQLFVNTSGLGLVREGVQIRSYRAAPGDQLLLSGFIGDHGAAIVDARGELALYVPVESGCQPLNGLVEAMLDASAEIHCLRDATRGGVATVLNEFAQDSGVCLRLQETLIPVRETVRGVCELLGLDPLYLANEGVLVAVVPKAAAEAVLKAMRSHPSGVNACCVGEVTERPQRTVVLETVFGGERVVDVLFGDQLPRIC